MSRMVFERAALAFFRSILRTKLPPDARSILLGGIKQDFCQQVLLSSITAARSQLFSPNELDKIFLLTPPGGNGEHRLAAS